MANHVSHNMSRGVTLYLIRAITSKPLRQRKKICASKQRSTNLEKKFVQRFKCIEKNSCRDMRLKKKIVPQKFYTPLPPPPGIANGPPLIGKCMAYKLSLLIS